MAQGTLSRRAWTQCLTNLTQLMSRMANMTPIIIRVCFTVARIGTVANGTAQIGLESLNNVIHQQYAETYMESSEYLTHYPHNNRPTGRYHPNPDSIGVEAAYDTNSHTFTPYHSPKGTKI